MKRLSGLSGTDLRRKTRKALTFGAETVVKPRVIAETPRGGDSPWARYGRKGPAASNVVVRTERPRMGEIARVSVGYDVAHARWFLLGTDPHDIFNTWGIPGFRTRHPGARSNDVYGRALQGVSAPLATAVLDELRR